jgi:hypothetical protein
LPETGEGLLKEMATAVTTNANAAPRTISCGPESQDRRAGGLVMVTPERMMSRASDRLRFGAGARLKLRAVGAGEEAGGE